MYIVTSGEVEIVLRGKVLETVGIGSVFGEMAIIDDLERSAEAYAKTEVKVVVIDQARFYQLTRNDPAFALRIMKNHHPPPAQTRQPALNSTDGLGAAQT